MLIHRTNTQSLFWLADDGRVYSGPDQKIVGTSDAGYVEFIATGAAARMWPRDATNAQTNDALQAAIAPYGMFVDLIAYASNKRYTKEIGGITVSGMSILTDDRSKQMLMGARIAADANGAFTTPWVCGDGTIVVVNAAQVIGVSDAVLAHVASCFATFATVQAAITGASITTKAEIDAAFA